ncbi:MAG: 23S rRNA (uracil(1939)-C(5))-methyltransferase RlmD [Desulfovibrionaceae bacterium]
MSSKILIISALSSQGEGIAKDNSKIYFVRGALPGQKVLAKIVQEKKQYTVAETEHILEDIRGVREYICPHQECGGCPLQGISLEEEEQYKKNRILSDFKKIAKISEIDLEIVSLSTIQYRNKMEFAFGYDEKGEKSIGLYKAKSNTVVSVTQCALVPSVYMQILSLVREHLQKSSFSVWRNKKGFWRYIVIRHSLLHNKYMVHCITGRSFPSANEEIKKLASAITELPGLSFIHSERKSTYNVAFGEKVLFQMGENYLEESLYVNGKQSFFCYGVNDFFQINTEMASLLFQEVVLSIPFGSRLLDLCCGVGSIGLSCSSQLTELYGIENMKSSLYFAKYNAQKNVAIKTKYTAKDIKDITYEESVEYDCVCVDPPRGGSCKETISVLCKAKIPILIYISCNPATLARDIALLSKIYEIKRAKGFNMFRFSPHIEVVMVCTARK